MPTLERVQDYADIALDVYYDSFNPDRNPIAPQWQRQGSIEQTFRSQFLDAASKLGFAAYTRGEYVLAAIQDLMLASDPYLVGRVVSFSDLLLAPIIGYFVQFQEGTRALAKLPKLSHWWLAMQQRPSFTATAPKM